MPTKLLETALVPQAVVSQADRQAVQQIDRCPEPINQFEHALGGRQVLVESLAIDASPEIQDLLEMLIDPHFDGFSLGYLATKAGLTVTDVLKAYRNSAFFKAHILSTQKIADRLPAIVEDVMRRATDYTDICELCEGVGTIPPIPSRKKVSAEHLTCTKCKGTGRVHKSPEIDYQKLALELGELLKSPRGPQVLQQIAINQTNTNMSGKAGSSSIGSLEQMQQAVSELLYGSKPVIDIPFEVTNPPGDLSVMPLPPEV